MNRPKASARQVVGRRRQRKHAQERGNTRRRKLLDAAEELLRTTPIEELSFRQISEQAGVPEGSAYHFFANRYDLLMALAGQIAARFGEIYAKPVPAAKIRDWGDLVDVFVDRAVRAYQANPAATQIWLSGRTPAQVRLADHVSDKAVSNVIRDAFARYFELPELPEDYDVFFHFMEICDVLLSLSVIEHGRITPPMVEEAKRAGKAYLGTYLPPVLKRRKA